MFPYNSMQPQRPVVYVFVGQNGGDPSASASASAQALFQSQQQQQQALGLSQQQHYARSAPGTSAASPSGVEILRTGTRTGGPPQPLTARSTAISRRYAASPSSTPRRRESSSSYEGRDGFLRTGSRHRHAPPHARGDAPPPPSHPTALHTYGGGGGSSSSSNAHHHSHHEGVQIVSIPQFGGATTSSSLHHAAAQHQAGAGAQFSAFPPPGATIQMIQQIPHSAAAAQGATFSSLPTSQTQSFFTNPSAAAASSLLTQQTILQQHHHAAAAPTALSTASSPAAAIREALPSQLDPTIKFIFAPPGVAIPPQTVPTYQLVPAGHQVVPVTNGRARVVNKSATSTAEARVAAEQEEDEAQDEEALFREPIVLSGKPYSYPVNIGKDVVSGKGGRAQQYNKHFRRLITDAYPRYNETGSKIEKREIGIRIYLSIVKAGGRFLDAQGNPMNRSKAILKVMKALKDAKTWANDEKRLASKERKAKRKREKMDAELNHEDSADEEEEEDVEVVPHQGDERKPQSVAPPQAAEQEEGGDLHDDEDDGDEHMDDEDDETADEEELSDAVADEERMPKPEKMPVSPVAARALPKQVPVVAHSGDKKAHQVSVVPRESSEKDDNNRLKEASGVVPLSPSTQAKSHSPNEPSLARKLKSPPLPTTEDFENDDGQEASCVVPPPPAKKARLEPSAAEERRVVDSTSAEPVTKETPPLSSSNTEKKDPPPLVPAKPSLEERTAAQATQKGTTRRE